VGAPGPASPLRIVLVVLDAAALLAGAAGLGALLAFLLRALIS
jgi:hypothetical protein